MHTACRALLSYSPSLCGAWSMELTSPCTFPVLPGLVSINKTSAETVPASPAANPAQGSDRGVTALLCYLWLCFQ